MQDRGKVINKLALVLLSIVVLELVLIGDQVQPVKAIKKKIYLKKLKKILPLLALVKPKKKLILLPIPIPMFKKEPYSPHSFRNNVPQAQQPHQHMAVGQSQPMSMSGSNDAMTFMVMDPNLLPQTPLTEPGEMSSHMMMMPSMTMTIQSDGHGTMSAIELTPGGNRANSTSGALITAGRPTKWHEQQQHDHLADEQFSLNDFLQPIKERPREGDHYYASPWGSAPAAATSGSRLPLVSPAKFLRNGRLKQRPSQASAVRRPEEPKGTVAPSGQQTIALITANSQPKKPQPQQRFAGPMPVVVINNHWRPSSSTANQQRPSGGLAVESDQSRGSNRVERLREQQPAPGPKLSKHQEQQIASALERESLVQVGPARMIPIYQSANGRISVTPPPAGGAAASLNASEHAHAAPQAEHHGADSNAEVQTNDASTSLLRSSPPPRAEINAAADSNSNHQDQSFEHEPAEINVSDRQHAPAGVQGKRPAHPAGVKRASSDDSAN